MSLDQVKMSHFSLSFQLDRLVISFNFQLVCTSDFCLLNEAKLNIMSPMSVNFLKTQGYRWHALSLGLHILFFLGMGVIVAPQKSKNLTEIEVIHIPQSINENPPVVKPEVQKTLIKQKNSLPREISKNLQKQQIPIKQNSRKLISKHSSNLNHASSIKAVYIAKLRDQIEARKKYPRIAKKLKQSGKVVIMLEILKNGRILKKQIVEESPFQRLNKAAYQLVAQLESVEPLPEELHLDSWQVFIPVAYVLR
ncbi:MAG: TonB family protein [Bdellovibrionales bacterium]|nr:TonB family protein [Bdellovibrionales bacterium]